MRDSHPSILLKMRSSRLCIALMLYAMVCFSTGILEWLFFYTKPSFMDSLALSDVVTLTIIPSFWLFLIGSFLMIILALLPVPKLVLCVPAILLGSLLIILFDNFIYTMFGWGITNALGTDRYIFTALYLIFLVLSAQYLIQKAGSCLQHVSRFSFLLTGSVVLLALVISVVMTVSDWGRYQILASSKPEETLRRPNIIFFAGDGVEARYTSAYGYNVESTPALNTIAETALVFANAFSPSGRSTGATTSMLAGKNPFRTKVVLAPQVLAGVNAFQHFPAMLRNLGYTGYQSSIRFYIDSADLNMQQSFDVSNGRTIWNPDPDTVVGKLALIFGDEIYFSRRVLDRFSSRLQHILGIQDMFNYFLLVSQDTGLDWANDRKAVDGLIEFVKETDQPYFAHVHLMGSHCCEHRHAKSQLLTEVSGDASQEIQDENEIRRYVNTIRDVDDHLSYLLDKLSSMGELDNTILVISSDHTRGWSTLERVPLIIAFPDNAHAGVYHNNVQLTDVAPTLLNYMGIQKPDWMDGRDLLSRDGQQSKPIVTVETEDDQIVNNVLPAVHLINPGPPRHGVGQVGVIICNTSMRVSLDTGKVVTSDVAGHTLPCDSGQVPDDQWISQYVRNILDENNFTTPFQKAD
jgi:hypothetical protein